MVCMLTILLLVVVVKARPDKLTSILGNAALESEQPSVFFPPQIVRSITEDSATTETLNFASGFEHNKEYDVPKAYSYRIQLLEETTTTTKEPDNLLFSPGAGYYDIVNNEEEVNDSSADFIDPDYNTEQVTEHSSNITDTENDHYYYDTEQESCFPYCNFVSYTPRPNDTDEDTTTTESISFASEHLSVENSDKSSHPFHSNILVKPQKLNDINDESIAESAESEPEYSSGFVDFTNSDGGNNHADQHFSDADRLLGNQNDVLEQVNTPSNVHAGSSYPETKVLFSEDPTSNHLTGDSTVYSPSENNEPPPHTSAHSHRQLTPQLVTLLPMSEQDPSIVHDSEEILPVDLRVNEIAQPLTNHPLNYRLVPNIHGLEYNRNIHSPTRVNREQNTNTNLENNNNRNNSDIHVIATNANGMFLTESYPGIKTNNTLNGRFNESEDVSPPTDFIPELANSPAYIRYPQYFSGHNGAFLVPIEIEQPHSDTISPVAIGQNFPTHNPSFIFENENPDGIVQGLPDPPVVIPKEEDVDEELDNQKYIIYQNSLDTQFNSTDDDEEVSVETDPFLNDSTVDNEVSVANKSNTSNKVKLENESAQEGIPIAGKQLRSGLEESYPVTENTVTNPTLDRNSGDGQIATDSRGDFATNTYYVKTQDAAVPIILLADDRYADGSYKFEYQSADGSIRKEVGKILPHGGIEQIGRYEFWGDDGRLRQVEYLANEGGFRQKTSFGPVTRASTEG